MFKKLFVWVAGIYLCLNVVLSTWDQIKKHGETFKVIGVHTEQTIVGKMYHIVAVRNSDGVTFTFDRFSSHSLRTGGEFDIVVGFMVTKKPTAKSPALREE